MAWTDLENQELLAAAGRWRALGIAFERLAPGDYARVEPALNPSLKSVYFLPDRAQVRNPRLLRALMVAISGRGGKLMPGRGVEGFQIHAGRVTAIKTSAGELPCGTVIVAAGPWSGELLRPIGVHAPTPPFKGQIVLLRGDRPLTPSHRRARQQLPGPARRRPDLGRCHRGKRGFRLDPVCE